MQDPSVEPAPVDSPAPAGPAYLPFGAYAPPSALVPPPPPTWATTYELPTARRVVSAGLQLALSATSELRRGSIYIGLLMLGAIAPVLGILLASLFGVGPPADRLFGLLLVDPSVLGEANPDLLGLVLVLYAALLLFFIIVLAVSIDAQAMAIALLAGRATGRPLRLWEALVRARQVFWRLAGAGMLVGIPGALIGFVIGLLLNGRTQSPEAVDLFSQLVATFALAPFAYMAAGIVIGDVGVIEAARRSIRLFRARPRIGVVVVLFPLITSAIQVFALLSGVDLVARVVETLHLDALTGGAGVVVGIGLVLLAVVALGSLIFTITAIVAAPQIAAFLGLTLFSGGIDKVRVDGPKPAGVRWVSRPMAAAVGVAVPLLVVATSSFGARLPEVPDFGTVPGGAFTGAGPTTLYDWLYDAADAHGEALIWDEIPYYLEDDPGDQVGAPEGSVDLLYVEFATVEVVPEWLLADVFDCTADGVTCSLGVPPLSAYGGGAMLVLVQTAQPPMPAAAGQSAEWGIAIWRSGETPAPFDANEPLSGASRALVARQDGDLDAIRTRSFEDGSFLDHQTFARALWRDDGLILLIPVAAELDRRPTFWDIYALSRDGAGGFVSRDSMRTTTDGRGLRAYSSPPTISFEPYP